MYSNLAFRYAVESFFPPVMLPEQLLHQCLQQEGTRARPHTTARHDDELPAPFKVVEGAAPVASDGGEV